MHISISCIGMRGTGKTRAIDLIREALKNEFDTSGLRDGGSINEERLAGQVKLLTTPQQMKQVNYKNTILIRHPNHGTPEPFHIELVYNSETEAEAAFKGMSKDIAKCIESGQPYSISHRNLFFAISYENLLGISLLLTHQD